MATDRQKRLFDILMIAATAPITIPVIATIAAVIYYDLGRPILFKQKRVGKKEHPFTIYKFRTMRDPINNSEEKPLDHERVTKISKWLREHSLDELPQIFNVLRGDMAIVGPRPRQPHKAIVPKEYKEILDIRPGLTGPFQLSLGTIENETTDIERLKMEWDYASKPPSIIDDFKMIMRTVPLIHRGKKDSSLSKPRKPKL